MAIKLLSFLGTSPYSEVRYKFPDFTSEPTKFIQSAILEYLTQKGEEVEGYIFLTTQAKTHNWVTVGERVGLKEELGKYPGIKPVFDIPVANDENHTWEVFRKVYECLKPNDRVVFDVTHAFRAVPILVSSLLNFARFNLNVTVEAIYYGEYKPNETEAPIWNIDYLNDLQNWTAGAADFLSFGSTSKLKAAFSRAHAHISFGQKNFEEIQGLRKSLDSIDAFAEAIAINHLPSAFECAKNIKRKVESLEANLQRTPSGYPIALLLGKIKDYYEPLARADSPFSDLGFKAQAHLLRILLASSQYVQAITIAREALISKCMVTVGMSYQNIYDEKLFRKPIEEQLGRWASLTDLSGLAEKQKHLSLVWRKIFSIRNPVDHAYMKKDRPAVKKSQDLIREAIEEAIHFLETPVSDLVGIIPQIDTDKK